MNSLNIYEHQFEAICPVDGARIAYSLRIETEAVIMAEDIAAACRFDAPVFHEAVADELWAKFGGHQTLTAMHGTVKIDTIRSLVTELTALRKANSADMMLVPRKPTEAMLKLGAANLAFYDCNSAGVGDSTATALSIRDDMLASAPSSGKGE